MEISSYHILGVMSGTSCDGIDLAEIYFHFSEGKLTYELTHTETLPYSTHWQKTLGRADTFDPEKINVINCDYTAYLAEQILEFIHKNKITALDGVASHGHTIFHQPERNYTLQIGNLPELAQYLNQRVICDFRVQDVQSGGQGAPLVPIGDQLLFAEYAACINLGGFANISLTQNSERIAFDICPFNIVLNVYAEKLGFAYDDRGKIAESGEIHAALFEKLNALAFYQQSHPKSLGKEWVRQEIFPILKEYDIPPQDMLRTFSEHIAYQLYQSVKNIPQGKILLTGGGAYNDFIIKKLKNYTSHELILPERKLIDYKEALIFGLLGVLKLRGEINILKSVTGAEKDHSSGNIFLPN